MPIPKTKAGETEEDFIGRCMDDEVMKEEYPENDQRLAVCYGQWKKEDQKMSAKEYEKRVLNIREFDIRAEPEEGPKINGYAAKFNELSEEIWGFREIIAPGAFTDVLENDVRATQNHDANRILGRSTTGTLKLEQDDVGLRIEIEPPKTSWADDLLVNMRRKDVDQMSFEFLVDEDKWEQAPAGYWLRTIKKLKELRDIAVVAFPAYPQTCAEVRAKFDQIREKTEKPPEKEPPEEFLRALDREIRLKRMMIDMGGSV